MIGIRVGTTFTLEHVVDEVQMFFFSAATNNGHRVHYDLRYATEEEGHDGLLVHGPLQAAIAQKLVTDRMGPGGRLRRLWVQHRANVHPHHRLRFEATVVSTQEHDDGTTVELDLRGRGPDGTEFLLGSAHVYVARS
jgi:hydroxyacyl-ACP dehydratase HTD2-like protein with hotdog domain